jgi:hypothetical protein
MEKTLLIPAAGDHGLWPCGGMRRLLTACPDARREMSPHMGVGQGTTPACGRQGLCLWGSIADQERFL